MKVALVTPYTWSVPGGVNAHVGELAANLRLRGHEVRVLAPVDGPVEDGVMSLGRTVGIPFNGSIARVAFGPRVAARIRVALRRAAPDVVHVHEPFSPSASMLAAIAARAPVVATFHTAATSPRIYRAAGVPLRPLWRKLAVKLAVSEAARATVEGVFGPGARVVPNGVDTRMYAVVPPADHSTREVLFFGRLERRKGAHVLVEATPMLQRLVPGSRVTIAGDGPLRSELEDRAAALGADVRFTGRFTDHERLDLIAAANVVCLPALGGESFGYTLVEAMAAGRACVASDISGYGGLVTDGADGYLVPPDDPEALAASLAGLLLDPATASRIGIAARERARAFDWSTVAAQVEGAYAEALGRS